MTGPSCDTVETLPVRTRERPSVTEYLYEILLGRPSLTLSIGTSESKRHTGMGSVLIRPTW